MVCPQCQGVERMFDSGVATRELAEYHRRGPHQTTRLLIDSLDKAGVAGLSLMDIGGGVGVIQHELFKAGVRQATAVDASSAYLRVARQEAERLGLAEKVTYRHGDFVTLADSIPPSDVVTLERVICCYPDMRRLVGLSSARAQKYYGVVFPRDAWWLKAGAGVMNAIQKLRRFPFLFYVHPTAEIEAIINGNGLSRRYYRATSIWQVILYARV